MEIIGISGQTGSGKSTLAEAMSSNGYGKNIEVDKLGHNLLQDKATIQQLTETFGKDILTGSEIDRKKLGQKAFANSQNTEKLNSIMHPNMVKMVERIIEEEKTTNAKSIIINAALLYKMHLDKLCTKIIYVKADPQIRIRRLVENRGMSEERAKERLFSQDPEPSDKSVIVIENNGSLQDLIALIEPHFPFPTK